MVMVVKNGSYCGSIIVVINSSLSTGGSEIYYKMCLYTWEIHGTILVGGFNPSEKYESVGIIIPNMWTNKKCSKPPTRHDDAGTIGNLPQTDP